MIRSGGPSDIDALARLHVAVWRDTYRDYATAQALAILNEDKRRPYWAAALASDHPRAGVRVAEQSGRLVGVISFGPASHPAFEDRTEIKHLYVDRTAQGLGLGRRLMTTVLTLKGVHPDNGVALAVVRQNERGRKFYKAIGGREIGTFIDPGPLWQSENIIMAWSGG